MEPEGNVLYVMSALMGVIAFFMFLITYRQHKERGFIFTNTWIWASKKERYEMDIRKKKVEYRFARNVFFMLGIIFLVFAVNAILLFMWLFYVIYALFAILVIYALIQWVVNERYYKTLR